MSNVQRFMTVGIDPQEVVLASDYDALAAELAKFQNGTTFVVLRERISTLEAELAECRDICAKVSAAVDNFPQASFDAVGRVRVLEAALRKLSNEVGALNIARHAIIETVSVTNWNCLMLRYNEALSALRGTAGESLPKLECGMGCGRTFCSPEGRDHHEELCQGTAGEASQTEGGGEQ